jgi:hypothetical protein
MGKSIGILKELPHKLKYLVEPAMKYGIYQFDAEIARFLERATAEDLQELASVAKRIRLNDHNELIGDFLDQYPITDNSESANLYFLFGVMDAARLQFISEDWNTVERHVRSLGRFGSFRLASKRAAAAKFLAGFGDQARTAIPALHVALQDEDLRVRVWAHYTLAVLEGNRAQHEDVVRKIFSRHNHKDELGCYDDVGREANEALEKFREMEKRTGIERKGTFKTF